MDFKKLQYSIHFIDVKTNRKVAIKDSVGVPRVSDEVRLQDQVFYEVTKVVWIYDEPSSALQRVNVGVESIDL